MKKKNYTAPSLSVEEYEMIIITSASLTGVSTDPSVGISLGTNDPDRGQNVRAKGRGIWDED